MSGSKYCSNKFKGRVIKKANKTVFLFGISNNDDAAALTALGLHALQHRGQEGCGIVTFNGKNFYYKKQ